MPDPTFASTLGRSDAAELLCLLDRIETLACRRDITGLLWAVDELRAVVAEAVGDAAGREAA